MDQEISFIPYMSGYRDPKDMSVSFITFYGAVSKDLEIVVRQDQILSASNFDFDDYVALNPQFSDDKGTDDR